MVVGSGSRYLNGSGSRIRQFIVMGSGSRYLKGSEKQDQIVTWFWEVNRGVDGVGLRQKVVDKVGIKVSRGRWGRNEVESGR